MKALQFTVNLSHAAAARTFLVILFYTKSAGRQIRLIQMGSC